MSNVFLQRYLAEKLTLKKMAGNINRISSTLAKSSNGNELAMVRVDKTLNKMMDEKPFSRWDVNYWHPQWDKVITELKNSKVDTCYLYEVFKSNDWLLATDHVRASRKEYEGSHY